MAANMYMIKMKYSQCIKKSYRSVAKEHTTALHNEKKNLKRHFSTEDI
jgi:hypothetical protein